MRKILFVFVLLAVALFVGCSKDDDQTLDSISLGQSSLSIQIEDTYQFKLYYFPSDMQAPACKWESNNNDVITIDNTGKITAIGVGEAEVVVIADDRWRATCNVTVIPFEVASITLNKETMELFFGEEETLTYTLTPENANNKNIKWSSNNNDIATVDSIGKVTAIGVGLTQITVTSGNGISDSCKVTINPIEVTGISFLENNSLELEITDKDSIEVIFTPTNATNKKITWSSSDNSIATVSKDGVIIGVMDGSVVVTATSKDGNFTAICNVDVKIKGIVLTQTNIETVPNQSELIWVKYSTSDKAYINATWNSSNPSVATITGDGIGTNSALIETKSIGTTIITATSPDGEKIAECIVSVKDIIDIVKITANIENLTLSDNGSITLHSRIVYPDGLDIEVTSAILLDENRRMISVIYNSDYCKFPAIPFYESWDSDQMDLFNRWIVHYQFKFDGQTYKVEENINANSIGPV